MALNARYLADKSALARFPIPRVQVRLTPLLGDGELATWAIVDLEVLYSSRTLLDYEQVLEERQPRRGPDHARGDDRSAGHKGSRRSSEDADPAGDALRCSGPSELAEHRRARGAG